MRKVIISDGENNEDINYCKKCGKEIPEGEEYCDVCGALLEAEEAENSLKPRFPMFGRKPVKNLPLDDDDLDDDDYEDDDDDDEDEDDIDDRYISIQENSTMLISCIAAGAVVIAAVFLIIGIFIGKNSKSSFIDHFDLHKNNIYIDVIED